jgi:ferredoxin-thioredoxin reductase catalytic subunit
MDPNEIQLETIDKMFEYEKQARCIDELNFDELRKFSKLYCKLYLKQQEVVSSFTSIWV